MERRTPVAPLTRSQPHDEKLDGVHCVVCDDVLWDVGCRETYRDRSQAYTTKNRMMRIYKVLKVSKESKQWPFGSYPPKLQKAAPIKHNRACTVEYTLPCSTIEYTLPSSTVEYTAYHVLPVGSHQPAPGGEGGGVGGGGGAYTK